MDELSYEYFITGYAIYVFALCMFEIALDLYQKKQSFNFKLTITNLLIAAIQKLNIFLGLPVFIAYDVIYGFSRFWHFKWRENSIWHLLVAIVLVDFSYYIYHWCAHNWNIVWGGHSVHHQSTDYNISVAGRDGIFEGFFGILPALPLAFIGMPPFLLFTAILITRAYMVFLHTQKIGKLGILEYVFNTPSQHRVHHYRNIVELGGTKNLSGVFSIWDRLFGTFFEEKTRTNDFGIMDHAPIYNPIKSQTHFYKHLFKLLWRVPWKDKFKLLFSNYMPEPVPAPVPQKISSKQPSLLSAIFCFFSIVVIWQIFASVVPVFSKEIRSFRSHFNFAKLLNYTLVIVLALYATSFISSLANGLRHTKFLGVISILLLALIIWYRIGLNLNTLFFSKAILLLACGPLLVMTLSGLKRFTKKTK